VKKIKRILLKSLATVTLAAFFSCGINTTNSHGDNKGVVVLAYHSEAIEEDVMSMLSGEVSSGHSLSSIPAWYEKQAGNYGVKSTLSLDFHPDQFVVPESQRSKENRLLNLSDFTDHLRCEDERLLDYNFIAIYNVVFTEFQSFIRTAEIGLANQDKQSFFLNVLTTSKYYVGNSLPDPELFAHEYLHLMKANDKYDIKSGDCKINPQTGEKYLSEDIMCRYEKLESATITEPTARELGWIE
jgi:hypothetical protein